MHFSYKQLRSMYFQCINFCFFTQTIPKTLNPQWREQFDFHLYDEQGGFVDITVWDKDAGKKDDFMGRYSGLQQSEMTVSCQTVYETGVACQNYACF